MRKILAISDTREQMTCERPFKLSSQYIFPLKYKALLEAAKLLLKRKDGKLRQK